MQNYIVPVEIDPDGEFFVTFPQEMLDSLGWKENDTLVWTDNKNGSWSLAKKSQNENLSVKLS